MLKLICLLQCITLKSKLQTPVCQTCSYHRPCQFKPTKFKFSRQPCSKSEARHLDIFKQPTPGPCLMMFLNFTSQVKGEATNFGKCAAFFNRTSTPSWRTLSAQLLCAFVLPQKPWAKPEQVALWRFGDYSNQKNGKTPVSSLESLASTSLPRLLCLSQTRTFTKRPLFWVAIDLFRRQDLLNAKRETGVGSKPLLFLRVLRAAIIAATLPTGIFEWQNGGFSCETESFYIYFQTQALCQSRSWFQVFVIFCCNNILSILLHISAILAAAHWVKVCSIVRWDVFMSMNGNLNECIHKFIPKTVQWCPVLDKFHRSWRTCAKISSKPTWNSTVLKAEQAYSLNSERKHLE